MTAELTVAVLPADDEETADLVRRLRSELLDLDVDAVEPVDTDVPDGAKSGAGIGATLAVRLGATALKTLFGKLRDWVARTGRSVEVTIDGDTVKVTNPTAEQQEQLVNAWISRHAPGA